MCVVEVAAVNVDVWMKLSLGGSSGSSIVCRSRLLLQLGAMRAGVVGMGVMAEGTWPLVDVCGGSDSG